jgi:Protein of unknown function (DUF2778)
MSDGVYEDYAGIPLSALPLGRLKWMRALPGVAIAASSVALLYVATARHSAPPPQFASQEAQPAVNPFGSLTPGSDSLRLDSVSPAELEQFGSLSPKFESGQPAAPPVASGDRFSTNTPFGGLGDLQASVSWGSLALRFGPELEGGSSPADSQVANSAPLNPPLPPKRPTDLPSTLETPGPTPSVAEAPQPRLTVPDVSGFIAHLFPGTGSQPSAGVASNPPAKPNAVVAYAAPDTTSITRTTHDNPILRSFMPSALPGALSRYDKFTAVYDIEARVVYLPNGSRIEAHSGYGDLKDDPRRVSVPARGATPPATYELTMRESLFHGVQALRLNPVGSSGDQYGRAGFLAHPYMLGEGGDSNGCVSLKDYDAFLAAYQSGQIKTLVVVAKLD